MKLRRLTALALVLGMFSPAQTQARLRMEGFDKMPLAVPSASDGNKLLKLAFGAKTFAKLQDSKNTYTVVFDDKKTIMTATGGSGDVVDNIGAYFEKDQGTSFKIHVNTDYVARTVDGAFKTVADFSTLSEEEQATKKLMGSRRLALGLMAHEAMHALQYEASRFGFKDEMVAPGIHDNLAHDRYDEYEGYVSQYTFLGRKDPQGDSRKDADKYYAHLPTKYLIVKNGQEAEGQAPFPWGGAVDGKTANFNSFLSEQASEVAAIGGKDGDPAAASGDGSSDTAGSDDSSDGDGSDLLADSGADFSEVTSLCPDKSTILLAGDPMDTSSMAADAKRDVKAKAKPAK